MFRPVRVSTWLLRLAFGWLRRFSILLVVGAMLALNIGTLAFAPVAAAAGSMLARAGISTVADVRATELARARAQVASKTEELAAANRRAEFAQHRLTSADKQLTSVKKQLADQADELKSLRIRFARQGEELSAIRHIRYRGQTRSVREAVSTFADNVSRRVANAAARNLAAIPAESLPFFGIAVVLGGTAWELKDACGLMQEVHELNVAFDPSLANDPAKLEACGLQVPTFPEVWQRIVADPAGAIAEQPEEYELPAFEKPGWWEWLMSWISRQPKPEGIEPVTAPLSD